MYLINNQIYNTKREFLRAFMSENIKPVYDPEFVQFILYIVLQNMLFEYVIYTNNEIWTIYTEYMSRKTGNLYSKNKFMRLLNSIDGIRSFRTRNSRNKRFDLRRIAKFLDETTQKNITVSVQ